MKERISLALVLGAPVQAAGTRVGVVTDVYLDPGEEYVIGLEVTGPSERRWFLPWVAATHDGEHVLASSPLVFVAVEQIGFYTRHGARITDADAAEMAVDIDGRIERSEAPTVDTSSVSSKGQPVS